jgi:hypothetical protein
MDYSVFDKSSNKDSMLLINCGMQFLSAKAKKYSLSKRGKTKITIKIGLRIDPWTVLNNI